MVALRCLEGLFNPSREITNDDSSVSVDSKIRLDPSESCEDVLQRILHEIPASDLKTTRPELLKWDVRPFITHKRTSLPKPALQQLKDSILEGTYPFAESLKVRSGLVSINQNDDRVPVDDCHNDRSNCDEIVTETQATPQNGSQNLQEVSPSNRNRNDLASINQNDDSIPVDDGHDDRSNRDEIRAESHETPQTLCGVSPSKRNTSDLENNITTEDSDYLLPNAKKPKQDSVPILENVMQKTSRRITSDTREKESEQGGSEETEFPETCNGIPQDDASEDGLHQDNFIDGAKDSSGCCLEPKEDGTQQKNYVDEPCEDPPPHCSQPSKSNGGVDADMAHLCVPETSSDSYGYSNEKIDIALKKSTFLSSQCTYTQDSVGAGWTEQHKCMKCNKDGDLLVCSATSCGLEVHESCLGLAARFDNTGNFYCPFCAYSLSISEYLKAKKVLSLRRKELASFIAPKIKHRKHEHGDGNHVNPVNDNRSMRVKKRRQAKNSTLEEEATSTPHIDPQGGSKDGNDQVVVSKYDTRLRNQEQRYTYPATPLSGMGRKKLAWTAEEEQMLKEGVQRFSDLGDKNIPWKRILEFGGSAFHKGRTPIDLKDKWRNICKGSAKST